MKKNKELSSRDLLGLFEVVDGELRTAILLAACAGLRRNEIIALKWRDIDWRRKVINVYSGKTRRPRKVPIHPALERRLMHWRQERLGEETVFNPVKVGWRLNTKLLRLGGVFGIRIGYHEFRRWFGQAILVEDGERAAADLMGHAQRDIQLEYAKGRRTRRRRKGVRPRRRGKR